MKGAAVFAGFLLLAHTGTALESRLPEGYLNGHYELVGVSDGKPYAGDATIETRKGREVMRRCIDGKLETVGLSVVEVPLSETKDQGRDAVTASGDVIHYLIRNDGDNYAILTGYRWNQDAEHMSGHEHLIIAPNAPFGCDKVERR